MTCFSTAMPPGIRPTAWSMAVPISVFPCATRPAYGSRDMPGPAWP
jgi:hypothetical protein